MNAWESIQKTLNYIEEHIDEDIQIEELAEIAALSIFYYQRLFARLVKKPVREYIKVRRLARACDMLLDKQNRIIDVAMRYGFSNHETFTRAFKDTYGITPAQYRKNSVVLHNFSKPDLLLNHIVLDEGVPLIIEGLVLEMNRKTIDRPLSFIGIKDYFPFKFGKMLGERTGVSPTDKIWNRLFDCAREINRLPNGLEVGICYHGDAPEGYTTYFAGVEVEKGVEDSRFTNWELPAREYLVCGFEAESYKQLIDSALGKAMKYTRFWLKKNGLIADWFFPELYFREAGKSAYMELWTPFRKREKKEEG